MGFREKLNRSPLIAGGVAVVLVALAVWVVYRTATDRGLTMEQPTQYYYTIDDGKTLFSAPMSSVPPFEKDGKEAVLAHVFTCDKGATQFVGYLVKYSDTFATEARAKIAEAEQSGKPMQGSPLDTAAAAMNMLVKKPGTEEWVPMASPKSSDITGIWCSSRDPWDLQELYPK